MIDIVKDGNGIIEIRIGIATEFVGTTAMDACCCLFSGRISAQQGHIENNQLQKAQ